MMQKFTMLIGIPASGKSTYAEEYTNESIIHISSDSIREELYGNESIQGNANEVYALMQARAVAALSCGKSVIYDATNLEKVHRETLLKYLHSLFTNRIDYECVVFMIDLNKAFARNNRRNRHVPEKIIEMMYRKFQRPTINEGWTAIIERHV